MSSVHQISQDARLHSKVDRMQQSVDDWIVDSIVLFVDETLRIDQLS